MGLIRFLLALSVVVIHSTQRNILGLPLVGGQAAVQAFYVISGFYMALVLNRKYPAGAAGYRTFILARVMRLMPAYVAVLGLAIALPALHVIDHPAFTRWQRDARDMSWPTKLFYGGSQLVILGQDAVWFTRYDPTTGRAFFDPVVPEERTFQGERSIEGIEGTTPADQPRDGMDFLFVAQTWTLAVEFTFYLVAPFLVRRVGVIGVFFVLSCVVRGALAHVGYARSPWSYRFFPSELALFLLGSAGYHVYARLERTRPDMLRRGGLVALPALTAIILFLFLIHIPLRATIVIAATAVGVPFIFALTKRHRVDRWIGELSYPIYISHELVRISLVHFTGGASIGALVSMTLVASVALMVLVEMPFDHVRARFVARRLERGARRSPPPPPGEGTAAPALA